MPGPSAHDLETHLQHYGDRPTATGSAGPALLAKLQQINLTGHGGGHFPAARKWQAVLAAGSGGTVVANGAEGEPASAKDAALLLVRPHLVLDGLVCAAEAVGADECVVWLNMNARLTRAAVRRALQERRVRHPTEPPIRIELAPDRYLSGEASAVIRALSGGPSLPQLQRDPRVPWGRGNRPILIHNVETLARVGAAARTNAADVRPTSLVTVVRRDCRVVCEVDSDVTINELVERFWLTGERASRRAPSAVLLGGYGGTWLPWDRAAGLALNPSTLGRVGLSLGAGVLAPLPAESCGLVVAAGIAEYLARSSARQCGPCLFGLAAVSELTTALASGSMTRTQGGTLDRILGQIAGRGACRHPDGAIRMVSSALETFARDVYSHRGKRRCLITGDRRPQAHPLPLPHTS